MKQVIILSLIIFSLSSNAQIKRVDTTLKIGSAGYKVYCNNKRIDKNTIDISTIGFGPDARRDLSIPIVGQVSKVAIDDLNNDGFPDLIIFTISDKEKQKANVLSIISVKNESIAPAFFPDIRDDLKLRVGYNGHDEFKLIEGTLIRQFPIYNFSATDTTLTDIKRTIQYKMIPNGQAFKFVVLRSFDAK